MIRALPGWIAQVATEERSRGVPSHQFRKGVCRAFQADVIIGSNPLVAPACLKASLYGRVGSGWGHQEVKTRQVFNLLCLPPDILRSMTSRLRPDDPWVALTRRKYLTQEAEESLHQAGKQVFAWRRGAIEAASTGN